MSLAPPPVRAVSLEDVAAALDVRSAQVITLIDGAGLAVDFVAATLGITEAKTLKIVERARKKLAKRMGATNGRS